MSRVNDESRDPHLHKGGYSVLFSNKILVKQLIESFIDADFARELDFSRFEPHNEKSNT